MNPEKNMKVITYEKNGPPEVLHLRKVPLPIPKDDEVLIKVMATTVTIGDTIMRKLKFPLSLIFGIMLRIKYGRTKSGSKILGHELAGVIEAIGKEVTLFQKGDLVFASTGMSGGAYAEYICMSEMPKDGLLAMKPANMTFEEAAALPVGGITAFSLLKKGNIVSEQKVLIYGASGSVGTYAVQLAKHHFGAEVTGVCSTANVELIKSLGADHVIDYKKEDFTENDKTYNVIFDAVNKISSSHCKNSLQKKGHFISVGSTVRENQKDFILLKELAEAEKLKAVIDRTYPMEEIVEAHRYVDTGRKKGNVVITIKTE